MITAKQATKSPGESCGFNEEFCLQKNTIILFIVIAAIMIASPGWLAWLLTPFILLFSLGLSLVWYYYLSEFLVLAGILLIPFAILMFIRGKKQGRF